MALKKIEDWPLYGQLIAGAALLAAIVGIFESAGALASRFPSLTPASHSYVDGRFDEQGAAIKKVAEDDEWNRVTDRYNAMQFEIRQETADAIRLEDELKALLPGGDQRREQLLKSTNDDLAFKLRQSQLLYCQITMHNLGITAC